MDNNSKKILITGGTGFLGEHLIKRLAQLGYYLIVLKRPTSNIKNLLKISGRIKFIDIDKNSFKSLFVDNKLNIDCIIHLATNYGRNGETDDDIYASNVTYPLELMEASKECNIKLFINTDTVLNRGVNTYSSTKDIFKLIGKKIAEKNKFKFVNIKLENMYGPGDATSKFSTFVIRSCIKNVESIDLSSGYQKRDFIYIDDVVNSYILLITKFNDGATLDDEYHVGTGIRTSIREFATLSKKIVGSNTKLNFGAIEDRQNEIDLSSADFASIIKMGWACKYNLTSGLEKTIAIERSIDCDDK